MEVLRPTKEPFHLLLAIVLKIPDEVTAFLSQLPQPQRADFIEDLGMDLNRYGIGFRGLEQPFKELEIIETVPLEDGLTEFNFLERVTFVFRAFNLATHHIDRFLRHSGFSLPPKPASY